MFSSLLEGIGNALAESIVEVVFYFVGRIVVPVISLGRWHCEPALSTAPKHETRCGGLYRRRSDGIYFTSGGTAAVGGILCLVVAGATLAVWLLRH
jgi:hypothetical protein